MKKTKRKKGEFGPPGFGHSLTCKTIWEEFWKTKPFLSDASKDNYRNAALRFFKHFDESMPVDRLTMEQLTRWKSQMLLTYSPATTAQTFRTTKSMFHFAVAMNWLSANPLDGIDCGSFRNPESEQFVTLDDFRKIREQCTTWEQRAILTLARYGGLRSPSEVVRLKWSDIDWEKKSILVSSGKPTGDICGRLVPLFPAVRRVLEEMASDPGKGEFIVSSSREPAKAHFGTWFSMLAQKAGVDRIPRPFDNMRSSRGTELYGEFGPVCVAAWMGYSHTNDSQLLSLRSALEPEFQRATEWEEGD